METKLYFGIVVAIGAFVFLTKLPFAIFWSLTSTKTPEPEI
jgi:hypothetical protein